MNAEPHIGHALEAIQADVWARWYRLNGFDTWFLTGTDEHGAKIAKLAEDEGVDPKVIADRNSAAYKKFVPLLNLSIDDFIRTSDQKRHWPGAQKLWNELVASGDIYKDKYVGLYCVGCEAYVTEKDLVEGKCPYHQQEPEKIEEENYFFRLSKYASQIAEKIKSKELEIIPEGRAKETLNILEDAIDISFSRPTEKLPWGVPVPNDPEQTMYVWCDALSNYISALGYGSNEEKFEKYWPADLHCLGKDIMRFHTVIWPAMLLSAGIDLPKKILVHGFITSEGEKMSKSIGNIVAPAEVIEKYSADVLRYYLLREIPTTGDGDFSMQRIGDLYNNELADNLGNLLSRVVQMVNKYTEGNSKKVSKTEIAETSEIISGYKQYLDGLDLQKAILLVNKFVQNLNAYVDEYKPWVLAKEDNKQEELFEVLSNLLESLRLVAILYSPFMPGVSAQIFKTLNLNAENELSFERLRWGLFPEGHKIAEKSPILFPKDK